MMLVRLLFECHWKKRHNVICDFLRIFFFSVKQHTNIIDILEDIMYIISI